MPVTLKVKLSDETQQGFAAIRKQWIAVAADAATAETQIRRTLSLMGNDGAAHLDASRKAAIAASKEIDTAAKGYGKVADKSKEVDQAATKLSETERKLAIEAAKAKEQLDVGSLIAKQREFNAEVEKTGRLMEENARKSGAVSANQAAATAAPQTADEGPGLVGRLAGGMGRGAVRGAIVGGAIGFVTGGPAGAAMGAATGAQRGSRIGFALGAGREALGYGFGGRDQETGNSGVDTARKWGPAAVGGLATGAIGYYLGRRNGPQAGAAAGDDTDQQSEGYNRVAASVEKARLAVERLEQSSSQSARIIGNTLSAAAQGIEDKFFSTAEKVESRLSKMLAPVKAGIAETISGLDEMLARTLGGKERERGRRLGEAEAVGVAKWAKSDAEKFRLRDEENAAGDRRDMLQGAMSEAGTARDARLRESSMLKNRDVAGINAEIRRQEVELLQRGEAKASDMTPQKQAALQRAEEAARQAAGQVDAESVGPSLKASAAGDKEAIKAINAEVAARKKAIEEQLEAEKKRIRESNLLTKQEADERIKQIDRMKDHKLRVEEEIADDARRHREEENEEMLREFERKNELYRRNREAKEAAEAKLEAGYAAGAAAFAANENTALRQGIGQSGILDRMAGGLDPRRIGREIMDRRGRSTERDFDQKGKELRDRQAKELAGAGEGGTDEEFARLQKDHLIERRKLAAERSREVAKVRRGARADIRRGRIGADEFYGAQSELMTDDIDKAEAGGQIKAQEAEAMRNMVQAQRGQNQNGAESANRMSQIESALLEVQQQNQQLLQANRNGAQNFRQRWQQQGQGRQ